MTRRAQWYLGIGATRHLLIGVFAVIFPYMFANPVFMAVVSYAPLPIWGAVFVFTALVMFTSCFTKSAKWARIGLIISASSTLAFGMGILLGVLATLAGGSRVTPITAILLLSLAAKDYAVCTQPLCSPFESLLRRRVPDMSKINGAEEQGWSRRPSGD